MGPPVFAWIAVARFSTYYYAGNSYWTTAARKVKIDGGVGAALCTSTPVRSELLPSNGLAHCLEQCDRSCSHTVAWRIAHAHAAQISSFACLLVAGSDDAAVFPLVADSVDPILAFRSIA